jgi:hypothetical protein
LLTHLVSDRATGKEFPTTSLGRTKHARRNRRRSEMAAAVIERGYKFIAITDHTQGLKIAGELEIYAREPLEK